MLQQFTGRVARVRDLTHDVREIEIHLDDPPEIAFEAGQFVSFRVPKPGVRIPLTRPYSIASPPARRTSIDLLFNLVPGGPGSSFLYALREDDRVEFKGPAGTFVLRDYADRDLLFVATGTGIAPIRSMIYARLATAHRRRVTLVWGLRSERDLYYQDELAELAKQSPHFSFVTTLSRPGPAWTGAHGRVQPWVDEHITSVDDLAVYVCGNGAMLKDVTEIIRRKGVCPIQREQFYRDPPVDQSGTGGAPE
jgi:CDP-4-dehydro-6-deoxyglucose reductase, E3